MKAFDLCFVLFEPPLDTQSAKIRSCQCSGNTLFVGLSDGRINSYSVNELWQTSGRVEITAESWSAGIVVENKPITRLVALSALNRMLAICDGWLYLLDLQTFEAIGGPRMKWVTGIEMNRNPVDAPPSPWGGDDPFILHLALATRKKQILLCQISAHDDSFTILKDVSFHDHVLHMCYDGSLLTVATDSCYYQVDARSGQRRDLFPFDAAELRPLIEKVGKDEYALLAPNSLGMLVNSVGETTRPPISLGTSDVKSMKYHDPFIVTLGADLVSVYSIMDGELKQQVPFSGGERLINADGQLLLTSKGKDVFRLVAIPWFKQVEQLMEAEEIDEALELAQNAYKTGVSEGEFMRRLQRYQEQAALIEFKRCDWDRAKEFVQACGMDLRVLISLFPDLAPYLRDCDAPSPSTPGGIPSVTVLWSAHPERVAEGKRFLYDLLNSQGDQLLRDEDLQVVQIVLALSLDFERVPELILKSENELSPLKPILTSSGHQHYLALLHSRTDPRKAVGIWKELATSGQPPIDPTWPGMGHLVNFVLLVSQQQQRDDGGQKNNQMVWDLIEWAIDDERDGMEEWIGKIVRGYPSWSNEDETRLLALFRSRPRLMRMLLFYLVVQRRPPSDNAQLHTSLVEMLLDSVISLPEPERTPEKLCQLPSDHQSSLLDSGRGSPEASPPKMMPSQDSKNNEFSKMKKSHQSSTSKKPVNPFDDELGESEEIMSKSTNPFVEDSDEPMSTNPFEDDDDDFGDCEPVKTGSDDDESSREPEITGSSEITGLSGLNQYERVRRMMSEERFEATSRYPTTEAVNDVEMLNLLLLSSDRYRPTFVLQRLEREFPSLEFQQALVLAKLGKERQGLQLLMKSTLYRYPPSTLREFVRRATEDQPRHLRREMHLSILRDYLGSSARSPLSLSQCLEMLASPGFDVDPIEACELLPGNWSLANLRSFLLGLAEACDRDRQCAVCSLAFDTTDCFVYPNRVVVHADCVEHRHICPQTGQVFVR